MTFGTNLGEELTMATSTNMFYILYRKYESSSH